MHRWRLIAAAALLPFAAMGGLLSASPAGAVALSHVPGSYQLYVEGDSGQPLVLFDNHTVGPAPSGGDWAVQKQKAVREVTVDVPEEQAPITSCERAGQGAVCYYSAQYSGLKTATGIASESEPGVANAYVGGDLVESEPFWAVRTGGLPSKG